MLVRQIRFQCPKLRVHPAPGAHISAAGCTIFRGVHPECARFFESLALLHSRRVHGENPGCTVLREVHPVGAQNKTLISDTGFYLHPPSYLKALNVGPCIQVSLYMYFFCFQEP